MYLPLVVLFAAALIFFARILFTATYSIPWDFRGFHVPLATAVFDAMHGAGSVLWDSTTYCGRPLFADPQAQVFYPPTALAIWIAGPFGASRLGYILHWELVLHVFAAGAFTYLLLRRMHLSRAAALCGGLVFELCGFFASQTQHFGAIDGAAWMPLMWAAAWELRRSFSGRWFGVLTFATAMTILAGFPAISAAAIVSTILFAANRRAIIAIVFGAGASAIQLIPAIQLTFLSVGQYRTDWFDGRGLPLRDLRSLILPPDHAAVCNLVYCGIGGLALALIGTSFRKVRRPFLAVTALAGIWMLGTGTIFGRALWAILPNLVKGSLYPFYGMAAFCLGVACLSGVGLDRLHRLSTAHKYLIALCVAADLILVGSGRPMNAFETHSDPEPATLSALRHLTRGPLIRFDTHAASASWSTTAPLTQLPMANGYNPLALERLMQARLAFANGHRWGAWYEVENTASPMIDALNVRYILSGAPIANLPLRAQFPGVALYENGSALPRFYVVHRAKLVHTPEQAFHEIQCAGFRPHEAAVVEAASLPQMSQPSGPDEVTVQRYSAREVALSVRTTAPGLLVSSEVQYPGWRAWIDGVEAPILMTNGTFRGLAIPAGSHTVRFVFAPRILYVGIALTLLFICATVLVGQAVPPAKWEGELRSPGRRNRLPHLRLRSARRTEAAPRAPCYRAPK